MPLDLPEVRTLPLLDGNEVLVFRGITADMKGARRGDPCGCVFARTVHRSDHDAVVLRTVTWLVEKATKSLLTFNSDRYGPERVAGIRVGAPVRVRYRNDDRLIQQIRMWDDQGIEFVPGDFALLPFPNPIPVTEGLNDAQRVIVQRARDMTRRAPSIKVGDPQPQRLRLKTALNKEGSDENL